MTACWHVQPFLPIIVPTWIHTEEAIIKVILMNVDENKRHRVGHFCEITAFEENRHPADYAVIRPDDFVY